MSGRRVLALYALLVGCFAAVVCRLYWLCSHAERGDAGAPGTAGQFLRLRGPSSDGFWHKVDGALCARRGKLYPALFLH